MIVEGNLGDNERGKDSEGESDSSNSPSTTSNRFQTMTSSSSRTDRSNTALRPLAISQSLLSRSDGSSQFSFGEPIPSFPPLSASLYELTSITPQGNVTVLSSVTGPVEVRLREELVDRSTLEFNLTPLTTRGPRTKQLEQTIRNLFTPLILTQFYPRSLIQINSQTISNPSNQYSKPFSTTLNDNDTDSITTRRRNNLAIGGASEQAARINSITLALLDAGVQLRGLLIAVAVAFIPTSREEGHEEEEIDIILDPTVEEEELAQSSHISTISFGQSIGGGTLGEIVGTESTGRFTSDELFRAQDLSLKASQTILGFVRKSVEAKYGVQSQSHPPTPKDGGGGKEIKMCVAEDGREMSDPEEEDDDDDDEDQVMI